ncbi:hypothetical protein ACH4T9_20970 [Micromonospora sp. NPDC020750]|uniref:hypothetical protein n=1 Tax=unclassified Micromonospora TaxID=2617518 RepID=UPI003794B009
MADAIEQMSEKQVPAGILYAVDEMIGRTLVDLEKLVLLRAELTGDDPFGDKWRQELANERVRQDLDRIRAEARQRDPEEWAAVHARAREMLDRGRRCQAESRMEPPVMVRVATETVRQWRNARHAESEARRARAHRMRFDDSDNDIQRSEDPMS